MKIFNSLVPEGELINEIDQFKKLILSLITNQYGVLYNFTDQET